MASQTVGSHWQSGSQPQRTPLLLLTISKPGISTSWHLKPRWRSGGQPQRTPLLAVAVNYLPYPSQVYLSRGISNLGVCLTEWKSATTQNSIGCSCQLLTIYKPGISKSCHLKPWGLVDREEVSHNAHLYYYLPFPSQVYLGRGISNLRVSLTEWKSATTLLTISKPGISKSWHLKPWGLIDREEVSHNATYHFQASISKSWHLKPKSLIDREEVSHNATYHFQARYI